MSMLWESCGILVGFPWRFFGNSTAFQRDVYGISIEPLWDLYCTGILFAISKEFLWDPMVFPWDCYENPLAFLWDFHDMSMVFLSDYSRTAMESKLKSIEHQLRGN